MLSELRVSQHQRYQCPLQFHHHLDKISNRPIKKTLFDRERDGIRREREEMKRVRETGKGEEHYLVHLCGRAVVQRDEIRRERTKKMHPDNPN